ncbi:MAG: squalene/phytoene synthase family protein [Labilithrix sp.]|nr:squalene/phytoene synthase family protein [Labilithrix sp.]
MSLSREELGSLLERTSRTFALAIPLLDEPLRTDVGIAYLLFRVADTLEDATEWDRDRRVRALSAFEGWLSGGDDGWIEEARRSPPTKDVNCMDLLARANDVLAAAGPLVSKHVGRTSALMASFVSRHTDEGSLVLRDIPDLRAYCYAVAGIVGELLTELWVERVPSLEGARAALMENAPAFGEGLQLVNILKDAPSDAEAGRVYVPPSVPRAEVVAIARADLVQARAYVDTLARAGAPPSVRAFCELPLRLAVATIDRLEQGAAKLGRDEVMQIFADVTGPR